MKTIAFFNNKGGVGKTSLAYHVAWMLSEVGHRVVAADFDPQANLTSMFIDEDRLEEVWEAEDRPTVYGAVSPQFRGIGDVRTPHLELVSERLAVLMGDLELSRYEDDVSQSWPRCSDGDERSFRVTTALGRALDMAAQAHTADYALVDVGPNLGALNRSVLLGCDCVVVPLGADLFSLQGLRNMGPALRGWKNQWRERRDKNRNVGLTLPDRQLAPIGYVVMRHSIRAGRPAHHYGKWIERIPGQYRTHVLHDPGDAPDIEGDDNRLALLKDYRSLMPMAQEARKPMFYLKPADGAFGGHQSAVGECYRDFKALTLEIARRARAWVD